MWSSERLSFSKHVAPLALVVGCAAAPDADRDRAPGPRSPAGSSGAQDADVRLPDLRGLLEAHPDRFGDLLARPEESRLKIECALVVDGTEGPTLVRQALDLGPSYFYPASAVKTCAVIAAFQRLAELAARTGLDVGPDTPLRFHPLFAGEEVEEFDPSHLGATHLGPGRITAGHAMRKVMLVSDNAAFNHLYELSGPEGIRRAMDAAGLHSARIVHRLSEFHPPAEQLMTPAIDVLVEGAAPLELPPRVASAAPNEGLTGLEIGTAHTGPDDVIVPGPMDFARKNFMALRDLLDMNVMLLTPAVRVPGRPADAAIELLPGDRARIAEAMAQTPGASEDPRYDPARFPDDYSKFLLPGLLRADPARGWIVRDKIGRAYGFSVTNAQVIDPTTGRTLFVAATLYTNPNGVVGDGVYDYDRADRFFADLGEVLARAVLP